MVRKKQIEEILKEIDFFYEVQKAQREAFENTKAEMKSEIASLREELANAKKEIAELRETLVQTKKNDEQNQKKEQDHLRDLLNEWFNGSEKEGANG